MAWSAAFFLAAFTILAAQAMIQDGAAMIMPLELVRRNSSLPQHYRGGRQLLRSARMDLHDDLLTKGYYTSRVSIGTPPHEFALIVDTGSTVTYVPCSSCTHCGNHQDPRFSPGSSTSYKPIPCGSECTTGNCQGNRCSYKRTYAEMSSSSGFLGKDLIALSNSSDFGGQELVFGCETSETGDLYDQTADGIMGLGRGSLSIIDQLVQQNAMENVFSLCYGGMAVGGGAMVLGDFASPPEMAFTKSDPNRSPYYNIMLKGLRVAGTPLKLKPEVFNGGHGTVLDSGTTYAYLPQAAFESFKHAVKQQVGNLHDVAGPDPNFKDVCYAGAGTDISKLSLFFPSVELIFEGEESVTLTPENYLFRHTKVSGAYCLGVFRNADATTLLGGIVVRNMLVTYNRGKEKIGFLKTNCSNLWNTLSASSSSKTEPVHSEQPNRFFNPPPAPPPGLMYDSGAVEISMLLATNYSTFSNLTMEFVKDVVRELGVDLSQVTILNYTAFGNNNISVNLLVFPQVNITVEKIISRLEHHEVHLSEVFGEYSLTSWRVVPAASKQLGARRKIVAATAAAIVAACIVLVSAAGVIIYWQRQRFRNKQHSYQTIDQSSRVEVEEVEEAAASGGVQLQEL